MGSRNPPSPVRQLASRLRDQLVSAYGPRRVLNDPQSSLRRFDLLHALYERGINRFEAYRPADGVAPRRYPVFLRPERGTLWTAPSLLASREQYETAVADVAAREGMLAIEFCDTADAAGIYRKYACFIVGERIVPRHLFFGRNWMVKEAELSEPRFWEEELQFLESNPHAALLREVSGIANISWGRIDYALRDGQPQIWEINVTPMIAGRISSAIAARRPAHLKFVALLCEALEATDRAD